MLENLGNHQSESEVQLPRFVSLGIKLAEAAIATAVLGVFLSTSTHSLTAKAALTQIADNSQATPTQVMAIQFPVKLAEKN